MHLQPAFAFAVADVLLGAHDAPTARLLDRRGRPYCGPSSNASLPPALIALLDSSTSRRRTRPYFPHPSLLKKPTFQDTHDNHDTVTGHRCHVIPESRTISNPPSTAWITLNGCTRMPNDRDAERIAPSQAHTTALAIIFAVGIVQSSPMPSALMRRY
ncbi:hypothetical protein NLJ89_g9949 [Agrocybe chaxingu]|uniref:Uncharacterized protein n=1 Tax=Agrocybe chaxingu TaxID=84603 RepID=A0A9W8JSK6_9AGAR|nr:hypothetical protein NLJ89_g9949 [Agrocybe chaxingu]